METLFVSKSAKLKRKENTLFICLKSYKKPFPIQKIKHILLLSESRLNSKLLSLCGSHGVRISVFDYYGFFKGSFEPIEQNPSGRVVLEQATHVNLHDKKMLIAKEIIEGAAHNIKANLLYYGYRKNEAIMPYIKGMEKLMAKIAIAGNAEELMGLEGNIRSIYYSSWKAIDPGLDFTPRVKRPPNNPVNCLISFLNQMTYAIVKHEISKTHLNGTLSFLHTPSFNRSSLSLDLAEPFKPVICDPLIFKLIKKEIAQPNWFERHDGVCLLTETGRRHVSEHFSVRLEKKVSDRSYRELIYREALKLERHVLGVSKYKSFRRKV